MKEVVANGPEGWVVRGTWSQALLLHLFSAFPPGLNFFMYNKKTLRNELLTHAITCTVLSERGQTHNVTYCMITFILFFKKVE